MLRRDGKPVPLTPKAFELLAALVEKPGRLLSKEELLQKVWPDTFVEESNLAYNVFALRKALGDAAENGQYIETVPKRGYRFTAAVSRVRDNGGPPSSTAPQAIAAPALAAPDPVPGLHPPGRPGGPICFLVRPNLVAPRGSAGSACGVVCPPDAVALTAERRTITSAAAHVPAGSREFAVTFARRQPRGLRLVRCKPEQPGSLRSAGRRRIPSTADHRCGQRLQPQLVP